MLFLSCLTSFSLESQYNYERYTRFGLSTGIHKHPFKCYTIDIVGFVHIR